MRSSAGAASGALDRLRRRLWPPVERQYDRADCGPSALLSVLRYWGGDATVARLRELCGTDAQGSTLLGLVGAARAVGFEAQGARGGYGDLKEQRLPCIAHIVTDDGFQHFVVVYRITPQYLLIGDPGAGRVRWTPEEFQRRWRSGTVLLLTPTARLARERAPRWWRWIFSYFRNQESWLYQSVFLGVVYTLLGLVTAVFVQLLIDEFIPGGDATKIVYTGLFLLGLQGLRALAGFLQQRFMVGLNRRVTVAVNGDFLRHIFRLPAGFFDTHKTGDVTARIHDGVKIQNALLLVFGTTVIDTLIIVGSFAFVFFLAPEIGWVALPAVPLYGLVLLRVARRIRLQQNEVMKGYAEVESYYFDSLGGIDDIIGFNAAEPFSRTNTTIYGRFQDRIERLGLTKASAFLLAELCGGALIIGVLVYGSLLVVQDTLLLGEMVAAYSLLSGMIPSVNRLVDATIAVQGASVAATRLMDLLLAAPEERPEGVPFRMEEALRLEAAGYRWRRGGVLFEQVDLELPYGRVTGLCGPSGAGKTTLVKLLTRKYPCSSGRITLDGADARTVDLDDYRRNVAVVPESVKVFNGTLLDNVLLGRAAESVGRVEERVGALGLAPFLDRFPGGVLTLVGEDQRRLSAGERQVVGLIRALWDEPAVLIVDEGLNAVDTEIAALLRETVEAYAREHAVLLISHDLRNLVRADRVYLLEGGRIREEGPPAQLLQSEGRFSAMWAAQQAPALVTT